MQTVHCFDIASEALVALWVFFALRFVTDPDGLIAFANEMR